MRAIGKYDLELDTMGSTNILDRFAGRFIAVVAGRNLQLCVIANLPKEFLESNARTGFISHKLEPRMLGVIVVHDHAVVTATTKLHVNNLAHVYIHPLYFLCSPRCDSRRYARDPTLAHRAQAHDCSSLDSTTRNCLTVSCEGASWGWLRQQ